MGTPYNLTIMTVSSAFGTGSTIPLSGAATINGVTYMSFSATGATSAAALDYSILDTGNTEIGTAIYISTSNTLTSRVPTKSTNGNNAINASSAALILATLRSETAVAPPLKGYISGLTLATTGSSVFTVDAGAATDYNGVDVISISSFTKTLAAWSSGSGGGSWDSAGAAPSSNVGWYSVYVVKRPDTGATDIAIRQVGNSSVAPALASAYTEWRRIGSLRTTGSSGFVVFSQLGDDFLWAVPPQDTTTAVSTVSDLITLTVPTPVQVQAKIFGLGTNPAAGTTWAITSPDQTDTLPSVTFFTGIVETAAGNAQYSMTVRTNTSGQVRRRASAATTTIYINTFGWTDTRGKDGS